MRGGSGGKNTTCDDSTTPPARRPTLSPIHVGTSSDRYISPTVSSMPRLVLAPPRLTAVLSRMQLVLHATRLTPYGASRLVQAMSAWSVKTRRAPARHCRDTRVYGHASTPCMTMSTSRPNGTRLLIQAAPTLLPALIRIASPRLPGPSPLMPVITSVVVRTAVTSRKLMISKSFAA